MHEALHGMQGSTGPLRGAVDCDGGVQENMSGEGELCWRQTHDHRQPSIGVSALSATTDSANGFGEDMRCSFVGQMLQEITHAGTPQLRTDRKHSWLAVGVCQ